MRFNSSAEMGACYAIAPAFRVTVWKSSVISA
jgi:hypothetical protein